MTTKSYGILQTTTKQMLQWIDQLSLKPLLERIHSNMPVLNDISFVVGVVFSIPKYRLKKVLGYYITLLCFFHIRIKFFFKRPCWRIKGYLSLFYRRVHILFNFSQKTNYKSIFECQICSRSNILCHEDYIDQCLLTEGRFLSRKGVLHSWECSLEKDTLRTERKGKKQEDIADQADEQTQCWNQIQIALTFHIAK